MSLGNLYSKANSDLLIRYPSLVESSDRDGGSSVAVLTYLRCIIESINHPDLVKLTFEYLLAVPEPKAEEKPSSRPTALARRRRSQSLLVSLAKGQEKPLPDLFNLDDLVLGSLRSRNQQTVTATLRLISAMLRTHHQHDVSLIKTGPSNAALSLRNLESHERNTALLFSIIEQLMDDPGLRESYELHLEDAQNLLENHACSLHLLALPNTEPTHQNLKASKEASAASSAVAFDDPVLCGLVALLEDFLANDVETNLSLTHAFSTIASCARRQLDGWLLDTLGVNAKNSNKNGAVSPHARGVVDGGKEMVAHEKTECSNVDGTNQRLSNTPVLTTLDFLVKQVNDFRRDIESFDTLLRERRRELKAEEGPERRSSQSALRKSEDSSVGTRVPKNTARQIGSISERLLSETPSAAGSRSASPRGRKQDTSSSSTFVGRLSHLRQSPSRSPSKPISRAISPSPLRNDISADTPSKQASATSQIPPLDPLQQEIRIPLHRFSNDRETSDARSETSSIRSDSMSIEPAGEQWREVTLSQILTNVIILQEFVMELVAIVQVRASLFGEVNFE